MLNCYFFILILFLLSTTIVIVSSALTNEKNKIKSLKKNILLSNIIINNNNNNNNNNVEFISSNYYSIDDNISPLIPLSTANFSTYMNQPRYYKSIVIFTANSIKYKCAICLTNMEYLNRISLYYKEQYNFNSSLPSNKLAFFVIDVDIAKKLFNEFGMESVPRLYILPETNVSSNLDKDIMKQYEINAMPILEGFQSTLNTINDVSGLNIQVTINPIPLLLVLSIFSIIIALFTSAAARNFSLTIYIFQNKFIWIVISLLFFCIGVSGSLFCLIRQVPLLNNNKGILRIFSYQDREQYILEGIIVSMWSLGCGLAGIGILYSSKIRFVIARHAMILFFMTVFIVLLVEIFNAYTEKTRWYRLRDTIPNVLWSYMTESVKKNTGVMRRILSLSNYWIYDGKLTLDGYKHLLMKFKTIVFS